MHDLWIKDCLIVQLHSYNMHLIHMSTENSNTSARSSTVEVEYDAKTSKHYYNQALGKVKTLGSYHLRRHGIHASLRDATGRYDIINIYLQDKTYC